MYADLGAYHQRFRFCKSGVGCKTTVLTSFWSALNIGSPLMTVWSQAIRVVLERCVHVLCGVYLIFFSPLFTLYEFYYKVCVIVGILDPSSKQTLRSPEIIILWECFNHFSIYLYGLFLLNKCIYDCMHPHGTIL